MSKIEPLVSITSGYLSNQQIQGNFDKVVSAFQNTLSLDGSTPNSMTGNFDMNSNRILNVPNPVSNGDVANKLYVDENTSASAIAIAEGYANAAAASAGTATTQATNAASSATTATTEAGLASTSATSASTSASTATTQAGIATTQASAAATSAATIAGGFSATSSTSITIGTGSKTFTTQSSKLYTAGQFLVIASSAAVSNYMHGQVTSYSGTSLVVNVTDTGGSSAHTDWLINLSGTSPQVGSTLLSSGNFVTQTSIPFGSSFVTSAYNNYKLKWQGLILSTQDTLQVEFSANNGSTLITGSIVYINRSLNSTPTSVNEVASSSDFAPISSTAENLDPSSNFSGEIDITNVNVNASKGYYGKSIGLGADSLYYTIDIAGTLVDFSAINYIKITSHSGTATISGYVELWGIP